jgi:phosphoribosylanthranilate isomerase
LYRLRNSEIIWSRPGSIKEGRQTFGGGEEDLRIKICGISSVADAQAACRLGADALGLNFYAASPRCVDGVEAGEILAGLPPFVQAVALFVNLNWAQIKDAVKPFSRVSTVQWHGDHLVPTDTSPYQVIPAFSVRDAVCLQRVAQFIALARTQGRLPAAVLLDAHVPGRYGGTGRNAPWQLLADFQPGVPVILAGGLTAENVAEAIRLVRPYAVDVASGVEVSPGRKDGEKMRRFIDNARDAAARLEQGS